MYQIKAKNKNMRAELSQALASTLRVLFLLLLSPMALALEALDDGELSDVYGQGITTSYFSGEYFGCAGEGTYGRGDFTGTPRTATDCGLPNPGALPAGERLAANRPGGSLGFTLGHTSNGLNWESYRTDFDMTIKLAMSIRTVRAGGFPSAWTETPLTTRDETSPNAGTNLDWDLSLDNLRLGHAPCSFVLASTPFGAPSVGQCGDDDRPFDPFTLENPYMEIMFAPECELFGEACNAGNSDSVFAGIRFGAERASGNMAATLNTLTGFMNAYVSDQKDVNCSLGFLICAIANPILDSILDGAIQNGVAIWGHRRKDAPSMDFGALTFIIGGLIPPLGQLLTNLQLQESRGLWVSMVRNDLQWPGQGYILNCAGYNGADLPNCTSRQFTPAQLAADPNALANTRVKTARDRDYIGFNFHMASGAWGHGGMDLLGITVLL